MKILLPKSRKISRSISCALKCSIGILGIAGSNYVFAEDPALLDPVTVTAPTWDWGYGTTTSGGGGSSDFLSGGDNTAMEDDGTDDDTGSEWDEYHDRLKFVTCNSDLHDRIAAVNSAFGIYWSIVLRPRLSPDFKKRTVIYPDGSREKYIWDKPPQGSMKISLLSNTCTGPNEGNG